MAVAHAPEPDAKPTLPQTEVLLALSMGQQPYVAPAVRKLALRRRWIEQSGTRKSARGYDRPLYALTELGRVALAASEHRDLAKLRVELGLQKGPWL